MSDVCARCHLPFGYSEVRFTHTGGGLSYHYRCFFDAPKPMGCICPPTSEQTCQNPLCPRKAPVASA